MKIRCYSMGFILKNTRAVDFSRSKFISGAVNLEKIKDEHSMFRIMETSKDYRDLILSKENSGRLVANIDNSIALFYEDMSGYSLDDKPDKNTQYIAIIKSEVLFNKIKECIENNSYVNNFVFNFVDIKK